MRTLNRRPEPEPETTAPDCAPDKRPATTSPINVISSAPQRLVKWQRSRERLHLIYPKPEPEAARQARELLALAAASDPAAAGAWVPACDLGRLYREHRKAQGLPRLS